MFPGIPWAHPQAELGEVPLSVPLPPGGRAPGSEPGRGTDTTPEPYASLFSGWSQTGAGGGCRGPRPEAGPPGTQPVQVCGQKCSGGGGARQAPGRGGGGGPWRVERRAQVGHGCGQKLWVPASDLPNSHAASSRASTRTASSREPWRPPAPMAASCRLCKPPRPPPARPCSRRTTLGR